MVDGRPGEWDVHRSDLAELMVEESWLVPMDEIIFGQPCTYSVAHNQLL